MKILITITFIFNLLIFPQEKIEITSADYENQKVEMADQFRAEGKIYIVVAVIMVIMAGMFFYLYRIEAKVKKLEKEIEGNSNGITKK